MPDVTVRGGSGRQRARVRAALEAEGYEVSSGEDDQTIPDAGTLTLDLSPAEDDAGAILPTGSFGRFFVDWATLSRRMKQWIDGGVAERSAICFMLLKS